MPAVAAAASAQRRCGVPEASCCGRGNCKRKGVAASVADCSGIDFCLLVKQVVSAKFPCCVDSSGSTDSSCVDCTHVVCTLVVIASSTRCCLFSQLMYQLSVDQKSWHRQCSQDGGLQREQSPLARMTCPTSFAQHLRNQVVIRLDSWIEGSLECGDDGAGSGNCSPIASETGHSLLGSAFARRQRCTDGPL